MISPEDGLRLKLVAII